MAKQKTPHTNTQQNRKPEQSDLEADELEFEADSPEDQKLYQRAQGADTGMDRSPRKVETRSNRHQVEPEKEAHAGRISTRTPKGTSQGITARTASEESERQIELVKNRSDAQAGVNRSKAS